MPSIHGHEVMQMMIQSGERFSRASLRARIEREFGIEARFHTCSAEDLDIEGLIDFLAARGKFIEGEGGFTTAPEQMCAHE